MAKRTRPPQVPHVMADVLLFLGLLYHFMTAVKRGHAVVSLSPTMAAGLLAAYISSM